MPFRCAISSLIITKMGEASNTPNSAVKDTCAVGTTYVQARRFVIVPKKCLDVFQLIIKKCLVHFKKKNDES